jgi:hypothetical protein
MERGFPMPKGCYYKGYPTGNRREVGSAGQFLQKATETGDMFM